MNKLFIVGVALLIGIVGFILGTKVNTKHSINLNTVIGFDATETGLMLYTDDGNGYYFDK